MLEKGKEDPTHSMHFLPVVHSTPSISYKNPSYPETSCGRDLR
jgi:hypothetical protein